MRLGVIPSSALDQALWTHIAVDDEDLVAHLPHRYPADF